MEHFQLLKEFICFTTFATFMPYRKTKNVLYRMFAEYGPRQTPIERVIHHLNPYATLEGLGFDFKEFLRLRNFP